MSLTPLAVQTSFTMINKRNQPDKGLRGRQFEAALVRLVEWWGEKFRVERDKGIRHQTYETAEALLSRVSQVAANDPKGKGKARQQADDEGEDIGFGTLRPCSPTTTDFQSARLKLLAESHQKFPQSLVPVFSRINSRWM